MNTKKKILFSMIALSLSGFFAFALVEVTFRVIEPSYLQQESSAGWVSDPVHSAKYTKGFPTVDGNTFSNIRPFTKTSSKQRISFIGDSFVQSCDTTDKGRLPYLLEQTLNKNRAKKLEVMNFGLSSTGFVHYYIRYTKIVRLYQAKLVLVGIHDNDFLDASSRNPNPNNRPHYARNQKGEITKVSFSSNPTKERFRWLARKSAIYRRIRFKKNKTSKPKRARSALMDLSFQIYMEGKNPVRDEILKVSFHWLKRLAQAIRKDGRIPVFAYLPAKQVVLPSEAKIDRAFYPKTKLNFSRLGQVLQKWMTAQQYNYVSLVKDLKGKKAYYQPAHTPCGGGLGHFNEKGNAFVADLLAKKLAKFAPTLVQP